MQNRGLKPTQIFYIKIISTVEFISGTFRSIGALYHRKSNIFLLLPTPYDNYFVVKIEQKLTWKCKIEASNQLKSSMLGLYRLWSSFLALLARLRHSPLPDSLWDRFRVLTMALSFFATSMVCGEMFLIEKTFTRSVLQNLALKLEHSSESVKWADLTKIQWSGHVMVVEWAKKCEYCVSDMFGVFGDDFDRKKNFIDFSSRKIFGSKFFPPDFSLPSPGVES